MSILSKTYVRPSRDLRNNYAEIADIVKEHGHVIITHNGKGESVLIGIDDYAKYEEFLHCSYVVGELAKAKAQADNPDTQWESHNVLWRKIKASHEL